jgi:hypothetical protein
MAYMNYRIPDRGQADGMLLEWLKEGVEQSAAFLSRQRPADDFEKAYEIICGRDMDRTPEGLSDVRANRLKRQTREIVGTLSDINCLWNYSTDAKEWDEQKSVLNKMARAWYNNTHGKMAIRRAVQYAAVMGTAWILPTYKRDFWTAGRGDIVLGTCGPMGVLPIQLPEDGDIQRAYAVTIRHEVPIAMAHAQYPLLQNLIVPDRDVPSMMSRLERKIDKYLSPVLNVFGSGQSKDQNIGKWPTVDIFHTYVMDLSINETGQTIKMGEPGTSWEYDVPSMGSMTETGRNGAGQMQYRKAQFEDAMLYPLRRLIVWSRTCKISDGSSPWWHGKFPGAKLVCDDWPWEVLGFSILRDGEKLERARNQMMRDIQDTSRARMNPPVQYSGVAKSDMEKLNLRKPGTKLGVDMGMGGEVKPILPPEHYVVPSEAPALIAVLRRRDGLHPRRERHDRVREGESDASRRLPADRGVRWATRQRHFRDHGRDNGSTGADAQAHVLPVLQRRASRATVGRERNHERGLRLRSRNVGPQPHARRGQEYFVTLQ